MGKFGSCKVVQFCLENEPNNFAASEFPHFGLISVQRFFDKPSFVILNQNCEAFIIALCFSFVIFNAESICSPARLFDNSVNKAPRFRFGKQLLYIYSVRNQLLMLDCLKTLFIVYEITCTLKITSNRCKNLRHSLCNRTRVIFQLQSSPTHFVKSHPALILSPHFVW